MIGLGNYQDCRRSMDDRAVVKSDPSVDLNAHMVVARPLERRFPYGWEGTNVITLSTGERVSVNGDLTSKLRSSHVLAET